MNVMSHFVFHTCLKHCSLILYSQQDGAFISVWVSGNNSDRASDVRKVEGKVVARLTNPHASNNNTTLLCLVGGKITFYKNDT